MENASVVKYTIWQYKITFVKLRNDFCLKFHFVWK